MTQIRNSNSSVTNVYVSNGNPRLGQDKQAHEKSFLWISANFPWIMGSPSGVMGSVKVQVVWDSSVSLVWAVLAQTPILIFWEEHSEDDPQRIHRAINPPFLHSNLPTCVRGKGPNYHQIPCDLKNPASLCLHWGVEPHEKSKLRASRGHFWNPPAWKSLHTRVQHDGQSTLDLTVDQILKYRWMGKSMWQELKKRQRQGRPMTLHGRWVQI